MLQENGVPSLQLSSQQSVGTGGSSGNKEGVLRWGSNACAETI